MVLTVINFEWVTSSLDHYSFVELLKEFDLSASLIECYLHQSLTCVNIDESHGYTVGFDHVKKEHNSVADFKFGNLVVF